MENGSQGIAASNGSNAGALSLDMQSTGPTAPVVSATPSISVPDPIPAPTNRSQSGTPSGPPKPRGKRPTKLLLSAGIIMLVIIFIGGLLFILHAFQNNNGEKQNISSQFDNVEVPLNQLVDQPGINVLGARSLVINGQLRTNDGLVVAPSAAPTTPTAGQIYYDKNNNQLGYYNGSQFIYVTSAKATVDSLGGATGAITTGTGLQLVGNSINNSGVLSFQGQSGAVTLTAGDGVAINGTTVTNSGDLTVGNEIADVVANSGLMRVGSGTTIDPYTVALQTCSSGEVLKSGGSGAWVCGTDNGTASTAGNGLQLVGNEFSVNSPTCGGTDKLSWSGTAFVCSSDLGGTAYSAGTGLNLVGSTFNNTGTLGVTASGALTSSGGQNPNIAFADGGSAGQFWQWNGTAWALATLPVDGDAVTGNEIADVTGANSGLVRSGSGTSGSPYTLAVNAGSGLSLNGGAVIVNSPTCAGTDKLQWNGTAFVCAPDADTDTTYTAGTGLSLVGTTFSNSGVLSITGSGQITASAGQNPTIGFTNGSAIGQIWQWNGTTWALTTLPGEGDGAIGNEVTDVTDANSGLTRSGSGTSGSPYTLAVNAGNGLQLSGGAVLISSPTCAGTDKLQWNGTAFVCAPDVDTDTNTTYGTISNGGLRMVGTNFGLTACATGELLQAQATSGEWNCVSPSGVGIAYTAGDGLGLTGTNFAVNSPTCAGTDKLQWNGTAFQCSNDVDTDAQTLSWVDGTRTLSISNGNSVVIPDTDTTYSAAANGGLSLVGTQFALSTCANGEVMKAQATSGQWACGADNSASYSAGTGLSLVGTTFSNSGILTVTGSGAIAATAGQNPTISFSNGTVNGQFWQWNGSAWVLATLPVDGDSVTGNEVTNITGVNSGLARSGSGTSGSPYTLGLTTCANTEILQSSGSGNWACAAPTGVGTAYNIIPNGGLRLAGSNFGLKTCSAGELLQAQATSGEWDCVTSTGVGTSYVAGTGVDITGSTISNTGVLSVIGSGPITSSGGQNPSIDFVDGSTTGQFWQWNGTDWVLAMLPGEGDAVVGNEVTDVTGANSGLLRSGTGSAGNPYTLAVNAGSGLQLSGGAVLINSPTCSGTDKLQWTGTAFICSSDVDTNTTYGAITNGGLRLNGTNFGLAICASGELLQAQVTSGEWACVAPNTVGTGYTAGNGLGLAGTQFSVNSPTCAGTDKLQWNGTAFVCSADVNTDAQTLTWVSGTRTLSISGGNNVVIGDSDTTYSALTNGGLRLVGAQFALGTCTVNQIMKAQVTSGEWACAADNDTTYTAGTGISLVGTTFSNSGIISLTGTSNINITAGQNPTIGFVNGSSNGQVWQWNGSAWVLATISGGSGTLQTAYTSSTGGTTPEIKLDSTRGALDIQDADTTIGGNLLNVRGSNGSGLGAGLFSIGNTGVATFQNSTDSSAAFKVLSAGGGSIFNADTIASKVSFGVSADFDSMTKLSNPATLPTQRVIGLSWSPDSQYAVAGEAVDSPFMLIYKRSGDTFTKLPNPATLPTSHARGSSWSPDGTYMSITQVGSPYVDIYKRSGDTFTKLPDPSTLPAGDGFATSWSPDGQYMTVAHATSPYITIYKHSGDTFTKLSNPATLPTGAASSVSWSPDGQYMSVGHDTSPYITTYKHSGDTFTKLADPATLPTGGSGGLSTGVAWSPDSTYLAMAHNTSPYITIYKRSGDTLTKLSDPASLPVGNGTAISWSPTGNYISVAHQAGSSCDDIYSRSGDTFTKLAATLPAPLGDCRSTAWSPDGRFVLAGNDNSPYFNIYRAGNGGPRVDADIFGKLSVTGTTSITQGNLTVDGNISSTSLVSSQTLSVTGSANIGGQITFQNAADTTTAFQIRKSNGTTLLTADTTNSRLTVGTSGGDTTGALVVLGNKITTGDPAGVEGAMYYNGALKQFRCYRDTNWEACGVNPIDRGFVVTDEFLGGCNTSVGTNNINGELGWNAQAIGANGSVNCNPSNPTPSADHPGVFYVTTPAASNQGTTLALGNSNNGSVVIGSNYTVKQTMSVDSNSGVVVRSGLHDETTGTAQPVSGVWWEANPPSNANWRYCYGNGTTATCANSSVAVTANAWVRLEIRVTAVGSGASSVTFIINGVANTVSGVTVDSTNRVYPANTCYTTTSIARQCSYDYFQLQGIASAAR